MKFLRSVAGYTREDQIRNTNIRKQLNIFNLNAKNLKIQITVEISRATSGRQTNSGENSKLETKKKTKHSNPTVKMKHILQEDGTDHVWSNP
jgi:hypothetical protein